MVDIREITKVVSSGKMYLVFDVFSSPADEFINFIEEYDNNDIKRLKEYLKSNKFNISIDDFVEMYAGSYNIRYDENKYILNECKYLVEIDIVSKDYVDIYIHFPEKLTSIEVLTYFFSYKEADKMDEEKKEIIDIFSIFEEYFDKLIEKRIYSSLKFWNTD